MMFFNQAPASLVIRVMRHMDPEVVRCLHADGTLTHDGALDALGCIKENAPSMHLDAPVTPVSSYDAYVTIGQRLAIHEGRAVRAPTTGVNAWKRPADGDSKRVSTSPFKCPRATLAAGLGACVAAKRVWLRKGMVRATRDAFRSRTSAFYSLYPARSKVPAISNDTAVIPRVIDLPPGTYDRFFASMAQCAEAVWTASDGRSRNTDDFLLHFTHGTGTVTVNGREIPLPNGLKMRVMMDRDTKHPVVLFARAVPLTAAEKASHTQPRQPQPLGLVFHDGAAVFVHDAWMGLRDFIACWEEDAIHTADAIGRLCTSCLMCGRMLSRESSVQRGVGPECAKSWKRIFAPRFDPHGDTVVKLAPIQPVPSITVGTSAGPTTALPRSLIEHSSILRAATEDLGDDGLADLVLPAHIVTESALLDLDRMIRDDGGHTSRWRDAAWFPHDPAALEAAMLAADFLDLPAEIMNLLIGRYVQRVFTIEECNARGSSS